MGQPRHHRPGRLNSIAQRRVWPRDHNHGQAQRAGGNKLGRCPLPACIFGNDMADAMFLHQRHIARYIKRPFCDDDTTIGHWPRGRRVDQTQQKTMLVQSGKGRKVLLANGQKHAGGCAGQGGNSPPNIVHMLPVITLTRYPRRALQRQQRQAPRRAGCICIAGHLCSKGVGCVYHMGHSLALQIIHQSSHTAKPAHTQGQWLWGRRFGAPRIGKHSRKPCIRQGAGGKAGLISAPQKQDARHG